MTDPSFNRLPSASPQTNPPSGPAPSLRPEIRQLVAAWLEAGPLVPRTAGHEAAHFNFNPGRPSGWSAWLGTGAGSVPPARL